MEVIAIHTKRFGWIANASQKHLETFRKHPRFGQVIELPGAMPYTSQQELNRLLAEHMDRLNSGEAEPQDATAQAEQEVEQQPAGEGAE